MTWKKPTTEKPLKTVFWCQLWRADKSVHGEVSTSPAFDTQAELTGWIRENRREGDAVYPYRRVQEDGGFKNERLMVREDTAPDASERLAQLVSQLAQRKDLA